MCYLKDSIELLGSTDGFGRSDTCAVLRSFFQVDAQSIVDRILAE
jgi:pyruvate dehydrogenase complex dehydrogenase (E1) component